jgi:hypothetical protein
MPKDVFKPAIRAALRAHEIGNGTPYRLYFAGKGRSGASFGFMQGDLAAGQKVVTDTFVDIMRSAGAGEAKLTQWLKQLSVHVVDNPLSPKDAAFVDDALAAQSAKVDAMDETILGDVYASLDKCIAAAGNSGRRMTGRALLYATLWINMSGPPTRLLAWLEGDDPHLGHPVATAPQLIGGDDLRGYLMATNYYMANPGNAPHLDESMQMGALKLPAGAVAP